MLAEELHFARAAARLHIATPTLSVQIQEIERRLGAQLFNRTPRSVTLTQAGRIFLEEARQVLERFDRAEFVGRRAAAGQIGRLDIGYVGTAAYAGVLQTSVRLFRRSHPDVDVFTREFDMDALVEKVHLGEFDLGFVRTPMSLPAGLSALCILRDRFCLALPEDHPLTAQASDLEPGQLKDEPLVVPEQIAGTNEVARRGGFLPRIVARPGRMSAVLTEVSLGNGIAILPSTVRGVIRLPNLVYRDIAGAQIPSEVSLIYKTPPGKLTGLFIDSVTP